MSKQSALPPDPRDALVDDKYRAGMQALCEAIDDIFNGPKAEDRAPTVGFCVLMFDFNKPTRVNYMSNAPRKEMGDALRELLARWGGIPGQGGSA